MSNRYEPKLPSMAPDSDQIDAFKQNSSKSRVQHQSSQLPPEKPVKSGSILINLLVFLILIILGVGGWWFYDLTIKQQKALANADKRIHDLEQQLSVTGEEMGESTVAMQARLAKLGTKTEELWEQMDKLWASAWRKNQAEISQLRTKLSNNTKSVKQNTTEVLNIKSNSKSLSNKMNEIEINLGIVSEQLQTAESTQSQLEQLKNDLNSFKSSRINSDKQQIEIASSINANKDSIEDLMNRLKQLETKIASKETVIKEFQNN